MGASAAIDGILRFAVGGGVIATILVAPGMAEVLDRPTRAYFNKLDKRAQQREIRRLVYYMRQRGLVVSTSEDYMHGLVVTRQGLRRLKTVDFENIQIPILPKWDKRWRLVMFDIPESHRTGRRALMAKLKILGFLQLQRSVWVYPFPCRGEIEAVTTYYKVAKYTSYIEALSIDNEAALIKKFRTILP